MIVNFITGNAVGAIVKDEVGLGDMPWLRFPITDEYCREYEGPYLWGEAHKFYIENPTVNVPRPNYLDYIQERGYPNRSSIHQIRSLRTVEF